MNVVIEEKIVRLAIVTPEGRLDAFSAPELRTRLDTLLAKETSRFVIDLSKVPFLDSAGMALLVSVLKRARQMAGDVKLVQPAEEAARRILHLTKFDRVFDMYPTAAEAVKSF